MSRAARILRIDTSGRREGSKSRELTDALIARLQRELGAQIVGRDLAAGVPFVDPQFVAIKSGAPPPDSPLPGSPIDVSNQLIEELEATNLLVLGVPMYNFAPPAVLKAWFDLVARTGRTFRYTSTGPEGLCADRKTYVVVTTGGTALGSPTDFLCDYVRHMLGFIGIHDVEIIGAEAVNRSGTDSMSRALAHIAALHIQA